MCPAAANEPVAANQRAIPQLAERAALLASELPGTHVELLAGNHPVHAGK